jgi:alpha-D-ribose 1-methylphosphonate 5-triphosphate diphosphatase
MSGFHDIVMKVGQLWTDKEFEMDARREVATETVVRGGKVLLPGQGLVEVDVVCDSGRIVELQRGVSYAGARSVDAVSCWVLPGIVDIHGDAFERQIMPRPKTMFPLDLAMAETDRQLAANGITTAYHGVTISWEPGLRSLDESLKVVAALDRLQHRQRVEHRLHIRWEIYAVDEVPAVIELLSRATRPALAFNDHTGPSLSGTRMKSKIRGSAERAMVDEASYLELLNKKASQTDEVDIAIALLAKVARDNGAPMLSHDDASVDMRKSYRSRGAAIAEFPLSWDVVEDAAMNKENIVFGAPNVVRGGSHNGAISAGEAISRGQCSILASDYYYPALLEAPMILVRDGVLSIEKAWSLVSSSPARALGLNDRGEISVGKRADLIVVRPEIREVVATISQGQVVYQSA